MEKEYIMTASYSTRLVRYSYGLINRWSMQAKWSYRRYRNCSSRAIALYFELLHVAKILTYTYIWYIRTCTIPSYAYGHTVRLCMYTKLYHIRIVHTIHIWYNYKIRIWYRTILISLIHYYNTCNVCALY